jgi:acetyltransferase
MDASREQLLHLADGSRVIVRALRLEDGSRVQAFVRNLSSRSRRLRFFSGLIELSTAHLKHFLQLDPNRGLALVALSDRDPEVIIAEARCVLDRDGANAEFALAVADRFQRRRLGTQLVKTLLAYASAKGVRRVFGEMLLENHVMLGFARQLGFEVRFNPSDPMTLIVQRVARVAF